MSSGSSNSSILNMPDYGQGLAEALQAQTDALSGQLTGTPLQQIVEQYERPLRMSAAQIDNDVLRQTLLGGQVPIYESVSQDDLLERRISQPGEGGQVTQIDYGGAVTKDGRVVVGDGEIPEPMREFKEILARNTTTGNTSDNFSLSDAVQDWSIKHSDFLNNLDSEQLKQSLDFTYQGSDTSSNPLNNYQQQIGAGKTPARAWIVAQIQNFNRYGADYANEAFGKFSSEIGSPEIIYKKNPDGTDFVVPKDEEGNFILEATSETEIPEGGVAAPAGELTGYTRAGTGLVDMLGDKRNALDPTTGSESDRMAGFDAEGNFLGLAALAEDIQRGNLSRQREADLSDVERLSGRYSDVMDQFRPGTQQALTDASAVLEAQKDNLTGAGAITVPTDSTYGGDTTAGTMTAAQVADPLKLSANTQFGGELGLGQTSTGEDSLRSVLLGDARTALGQGLTEREQANIANTARARQTLMGRTFDQSGAIAEAEARVAEDNARRMQNRSFAQSVLGQEAGLQQGDITRGMAQEGEQAGLQQQVSLAQAQMDQQANAFDADAAMRASQVNQAQQQQANQFGVGATMDAQRLNEQLKQAGTLGYIDAATRLAALEDQYALDPFAAILGRAGGGSLQAGQGVFGQAGYGLQSGPQYLNPESGLGYISSMAANQANMYAANQSANASRNAGMMGGLGSLGGGIIGGLIGLAG